MILLLNELINTENKIWFSLAQFFFLIYHNITEWHHLSNLIYLSYRNLNHCVVTFTFGITHHPHNI